jgi:hypothetical protein
MEVNMLPRPVPRERLLFVICLFPLSASFSFAQITNVTND